MRPTQISYKEARKQMQPGDVIAFGGNGPVADLIKLATRSNVAHIGVILQTKVVNDTTHRFFNQIIESTGKDGHNGVVISRLSDRIDNDEGEIWWLPLKDDIRKNSFDQKKFYDFLFTQAKDQKEYDIFQAINSAIDIFDGQLHGQHGPGYNREDFSKLFCSELVAAGLEIAGSFGTINASEVTPIDLCRWNIYEPNYFLLKGDPDRQISRFNTISPSLWNV